ncbi:class I SAM-dependent DNA methyltransferase [Mangrovicella endophytica]|uniref:class I SAM-dependent DNA methyltransferase n=1 Tax=Mangrovicella endophytica TaxID=2066697 RepID=UPI000C9DE23F|nr:class I SAM-dependent methyltransferase [Mangrovicella endophytica]
MPSDGSAKAPHPASSEIIGLYERHSARFDSLRGRSLFERGWLDRFRQVAGEGAAILDLGCGSGEPIGRYLIEAGHPLTGIDSAPSMIALCRQRFPAERWLVADMRRVRLNERFGGLIAWDSFFHLTPDDQRAMFGVFAAHAARGAALMFTSGPGAVEAIGSFEGETLYHASLDSAEYRALLSMHGFDVIAHRAEEPDCGGRTVWLACRTGETRVRAQTDALDTGCALQPNGVRS